MLCMRKAPLKEYIYRLYKFIAFYFYIREFFWNILEPKRMQVLVLKFQYQKELSHFFKKNSVKACEFHMVWNSTVWSTLWA